MAFNWKSYIRNRFWYRAPGQKGEDVRRRVVTYWTTELKYARALARQRGTKVLKARILPNRGLKGSSPDLAEQLGIYKKWLALEKRGRWRGAAILLGREARKRGFDVQVIDKTQIAVFKPNIMTLL